MIIGGNFNARTERKRGKIVLEDEEEEETGRRSRQ